MEYRLTQHIMNGHDFFEGVRAGKLVSFVKKKTTYEFLFVCLLVILVLVDKDNKPQWKPNSLQNISEQELEQYFQKPPSNEDLTLA